MLPTLFVENMKTYWSATFTDIKMRNDKWQQNIWSYVNIVICSTKSFLGLFILNYLLVGMFMDKVKKFCDHSMILWEMAGDLLTNGLNQSRVLGLSRKDTYNEFTITDSLKILHGTKVINFLGKKIEKELARLGFELTY